MATATIADRWPPVTGPVRGGPDRPGWRTWWAFLVVASVLGWAARDHRHSRPEFATVWPAAGIAVLWLLVRRAALLSIDTALMLGAMLGLGLLSGIAAWTGGHARLSPTPCRRCSSSACCAGSCPRCGAAARPRVLDSPRMLAGYLACITAGVVVSAVPVTAVWLLAADPDTGLDVLLWIGSQHLRHPPGHHGRAAALPPPRPAPSAAPALGGQHPRVRGRLPHERHGVRRRLRPRHPVPALPGPRRADLVRGPVRHADDLPAPARAGVPRRLGHPRGLRPVHRVATRW